MINKIKLSVVSILAVASITSAFAEDSMMMHGDVMMTTTSAMMTPASSFSRDLSIGAKGDDVTMLQALLEEKGYLVMPRGVAKGYFGAVTKVALRKYQASLGVSSTGYFGPLTRAKLGAGSMMTGSMTGSSMSGSSMSGDMSMNQSGVMVGGSLMIASRDIVDNAVLASNVTTVVAAVKAAGLVDTLKGTGPFTVFAPNNAAFAKLPSGTVDTLLKAENKAQLTDILTYHVVAGRYTSADLTDGLVLKTVEGKTLKFTRVNGTLMINGTAMIETPNVISSNGVTHVIDTVLMPTDSKYSDGGVEVGGSLMVASKDIVDNALSAPNVTTVVAAVKAAGLVATLKGTGPFTVFAPDNNAFSKLPGSTFESLLLPENKATLTGVLTYHVVPGTYKLKDLTDGMTLTTVQGKTLKITRVNGQVVINGTTMIKTPNVISSNGVTHVIDTVLIP